jgi:geranylgeranyl pyrophosphate synthase
MTAKNLEGILEAHSIEVEQEIARTISSVERDTLRDTLKYALLTGGKRIRPTMCVLTAESLGGNRKLALRFGAVAEYIHNFLLVHDDIEDGDEVRRNKPSLWKEYGIPVAINTGDYMICKAIDILWSLREIGVDDKQLIDLIGEVSHCILETGEGQDMDIRSRSTDILDEDGYMKTVQKKTGEYLILPIVGGAIISHASPKIIASLKKYGALVGPAFQIRDDIIDLTEGKGRGEKGCDIKEGKRSLLIVLVLSKCTKEEEIQLLRILNKQRGQKSQADVEWVNQLFSKYSIIDLAQQRAFDLADKSKEEIREFPKEFRLLLEQFSDYVVGRTK